MQIRELERELGAELVERRPGDMMLTDVGGRGGASAPSRCSPPPATSSISPATATLLSGRLRLGVIPTLAPYVLPRVLPRAAAAAIRTAAGAARDADQVLLEELARGALDCVMLALPAEDADVETLALFDDPFLLAVPASDHRPARGRVGVADIDQSRLILLEEGHCLRDQALAFCATARRDAPAGLGATRLATVMQMVANGYGVTLLPQVAVDVELRDRRVKLLRFSEPEPARTIGLAWRRTSPRKTDFAALGQDREKRAGRGAKTLTAKARFRARAFLRLPGNNSPTAA